MASKQHEIEKELLEALKQKAQGAKEKRPTFLKRLHEAAVECDEKVWDNLTEAAQAWVNGATEAHDKQKDIPDFGEEAEEAEDTAAPAKATKGAKADKPAKGKAKEVAEEKPAKAAKANGKAKPAAKAAKKESAEAGYKGHRVGSRKEGIHKLYDEKGAEAATKKAVALGLSEGTAKSWIGAWKRADA